MGAWNALLEQLGQPQTENKQMQKFVKKYVPFKKKNNQDQRQSTKQQKNAPHTKTDDDKGPKVNKIEVHNEPDDDEEYLLWNLHMANNEDTETEEHDSDEVPSPQINVILTGNGMASKFSAKFGTYSTKCLFDSGTSHSCVSYRCFKSAYPPEVPNKIDGLSVQNASGKSMAPIGVYEAIVKLGKKSFTHSFIMCEELTTAVILGLDFSSRF